LVDELGEDPHAARPRTATAAKATNTGIRLRTMGVLLSLDLFVCSGDYLATLRSATISESRRFGPTARNGQAPLRPGRSFWC
jgi:hypothetical protein